MTKFQAGNSRARKLTNEQVFEIRDKYHNLRMTQAALAREYGVVPETIGRLVRGLSHLNVVMPPPVQKDPEAILQRLLALQESLKQSAQPDADALLKDLGDSK